MIQRESSCQPDAYNGRDWGLTQLGGPWYVGQPFPYNLSSPEDFHHEYVDAMYFARHGYWIQMSRVEPMYDPFDPAQNLDRFSTGYAVPAFYLFKRTYDLSDVEALRAVAFHWKKGVWVRYDPTDTSYLGGTYGYDRWVSDFRPYVESEDGVWNGKPVLP